MSEASSEKNQVQSNLWGGQQRREPEVVGTMRKERPLSAAFRQQDSLYPPEAYQ